MDAFFFVSQESVKIKSDSKKKAHAEKSADRQLATLAQQRKRPMQVPVDSIIFESVQN